MCPKRVRALPVFESSFPRRQQARRLRRAAATAIVAGAVAVIAAGDGATALAGLPALVMAGLVVDARRWVRLAARSRVGVRSEAQVRRALSGLKAEGWRLRHSLLWGGRGMSSASRSPRPGSRTRSRSKRARSRRPPGPCPGGGRVGLPASAALVPSRSAPGAVRGARRRSRARRGRGARGVGGPPGAGAQSPRGNLTPPAGPAPQTSSR